MEAKHCWSFDDFRGKLAPFFAFVRSWPRKELILQIISKSKIATAIITFRNADQKNEEVYIREKLAAL